MSTQRWIGFPNLTDRPPSPAKGRGRIQTAIRRAFTAAERDTLSATEIYDAVFARSRHPISAKRLHRLTVRLALSRIADRVGREKSQAHPYLWRLKKPLDET